MIAVANSQRDPPDELTLLRTQVATYAKRELILRGVIDHLHDLIDEARAAEACWIVQQAREALGAIDLTSDPWAS